MWDRGSLRPDDRCTHLGLSGALGHGPVAHGAAPSEALSSGRCAPVVPGRCAGPMIVPHELGQRGPPVRAIVPVGPAERDDRRGLDVVGEALST